MIYLPGLHILEFSHRLWRYDSFPNEMRAISVKELASNTIRSNDFLYVLEKGSVVFLTKKSRWRYFQIIHGEQVGYIWAPTHVATHTLFKPVRTPEDLEVVFPKVPLRIIS